MTHSYVQVFNYFKNTGSKNLLLQTSGDHIRVAVSLTNAAVPLRVPTTSDEAIGGGH